MRLSFCSQKEKRDENAMLAGLLSWAEMVEDQSRRRWRVAGKEGMRGTHRITTNKVEGRYKWHLTKSGKAQDDEEKVQQRDIKTGRGR